jgi:hypothetical protein
MNFVFFVDPKPGAISRASLIFWVLSNTVSAGANMKSSLFDNRNIEYKAVGTPGAGFGHGNKGFFQLSAFGQREK